jgi:uncharacterized protein YqgV (UPF0045/DUF77 family)
MATVTACNMCLFHRKFEMKKWILVSLLALATSVQAQVPVQTLAPATKKDLVTKVLQLQQSAIEQSAQALAEQPAMQMMQQAGMALQTRVPPEKREAVAKAIQAEVKKYLDQAVPLVRERAVDLAPTTIGTLLEEKFNEAELKQLIGIIESPVNRKFQQMGGDMQRVLMDKLVADTRGAVEPKVKTLEAAIGKQLGLPAPAPAAPAPAPAASKAAKPPAKAASK